MESTLEFGDADRRDIYEFVEAHGTVSAKEAREGLGFDERAFGHHLAILRRDGLLAIDHGELQIAIDGGAEEEYRDEAIEFSIRPARQEDLTGLVGVMRKTTEAKTYVEAETVADLVDHEEVLLRHNELETRMFFVATVNDEVVGWVHLHAPELEKLHHTAELTVGVLEEYRGHGIGSHLLERGVEWAASRGFEKIYQSVPSTNEGALAFLEEHGWEEEAVREGHYKLSGEYIDEVMLAKRLE